MSPSLHIGLIVNPLAGMGGSLALKGSDGDAVRELATNAPGEQPSRALARTQRTLQALRSRAPLIQFSCWAGAMGQISLEQAGFSGAVIGAHDGGLSSAADTRRAAADLLDAGVDIIVFAGGDGTARDIFDSVQARCPVLGIPTGVKMHSGVFAVSPEAAGELLLSLASGGLVGLKAQEVRDIDEDAFRQDVVRSRFYGELMVPSEGHYLQHTKVGGKEDPDLAAEDIAAWLVEQMDPQRHYIVGPGSTTATLMAALGLPNTLLGVDVVQVGKLLAADASEEQILALIQQRKGEFTIVVTVIPGQGYIFGRGNQQLSPAVIGRVGVENIIVIAAKSKLTGLEGRPLLVDTNDPALDEKLCGYRAVLTGYDDQTLYRVSTGLSH